MFAPIMHGDDTYTAFSRIDVWTTALKAGDPFSTWTPGDANGFGSPFPFFYHKLFNLVAAALTLFTGDVVTGVRLSALLFSAVMFYGIYQCAARFGADRVSGLVIATACVLSPYAMVCLVARGAVAEYSAMALIPIGIAWTLDLFNDPARKWQALKLFVLLFLIALAHLAIFIATAGLLILCTPFLFIRSRANAVALLAASGGALVIFVGLVYVPFVYWGNFFSPTQARMYGSPASNTVAIWKIFSPSPRAWYAWPVLALVAGLILQLRNRQDRRAPAVLVIGVTAFVLLLLMTRLAAPLWNLSDKLDFVQFPWRLLSLTTPLIFVAFAGMLEQLPVSRKRLVQLVMLAITVVHDSGMLLNMHHHARTIPLAELRHERPTTGPGPDAGGEYFPASYRQTLADNAAQVRLDVTAFLPARRSLVESAGGCTFSGHEQVDYFRDLTIHANCGSDGSIRVNQFSVPFLDIHATGSNGVTVHPTEGALFAEFALPAGVWEIHLRQRTYMELVRIAWEKTLHRD